MRRFWEWLGLNLGRRAGLVGALGLLVTLALGLGVTTLKFTTSNSDYLNKNDRAYINSVRYESKFGGDPMAILISMNPGKTIDDLFTPANQQLITSLSQKLHHDSWVYSDISPIDALSIASGLLTSPDGNPLDSPAANIIGGTLAQDPSHVSVRAKYLGAQFNALTKIPPKQQVISNPAWVQFLAHETNGQIRQSIQAVFPNDKHALFVVFLQPNLNINQESSAAESVLKIVSTAHFQNATSITTGVPAVLKEINTYLRGGILVLGGIAAIVMSLILLLTFSVRWRLLPFFIVAVGLVWAFGLVGYFGIPLTLATIAALPVLLGVSMDYTIQMHSRIEEEVVLDRAAHPIQSAARGLGPALLVVTFDAVFAFMAMWFAKVPGIRQFGSLLVVGIIAVCVCSIIATLAVLGIREFKSPTKAKDFSKGVLSRIVVRLGSLPSKTAVPLAVVSIVVFLGGLSAEGKLVLQTNPIDWLNPNSQAIKQVVELKNDTGSNQQIAAVVTTNHPWSNETADFVSKMARTLVAKYPNVLEPPTGIVNTLDEIMNMPGAGEVPPSGVQTAGLYLLVSPAMKSVLVADGGHALNVIFQVKADTLSSLQPVVTALENEHPPPGITVAPGGISIVGVGLLENLNAARTLLTYLALIFVGVWLALRLRSVVRSLLSLVPVLIAVGGVTLAAVALGIKLSPLTAVSGPLVVAVCTEFTSLMLLRFVEERNRGYEPAEAMRVTASRTGRAFMVSGMTAIAGIGVVATSPMPLLSDFGLIVALNVGVALICALVVLPPILVWADDSGRNWVSRGLLRPVPQPIEFEQPSPLARDRGEREREGVLVPTSSSPAPHPGPGGPPEPDSWRLVPAPTAGVQEPEPVAVAAAPGPSATRPYQVPEPEVPLFAPDEPAISSAQAAGTFAQARDALFADTDSGALGAQPEPGHIAHAPTAPHGAAWPNGTTYLPPPSRDPGHSQIGPEGGSNGNLGYAPGLEEMVAPTPVRENGAVGAGEPPPAAVAWPGSPEPVAVGDPTPPAPPNAHAPQAPGWSMAGGETWTPASTQAVPTTQVPVAEATTEPVYIRIPPPPGPESQVVPGYFQPVDQIHATASHQGGPSGRARNRGRAKRRAKGARLAPNGAPPATDALSLLMNGQGGQPNGPPQAPGQ
jgi:hydrophobe/amphiphile efflux-3 (HAE3) family protein